MRNNRGDHARGDRCKDVLATCVSPFVSARGMTQMMLTVVDGLGCMPVIVAHLFATFPIVLAAVILAPPGVIAGLGATVLVATLTVPVRLRDSG